jgi:hypothetical protein
LRNPLRRRAFGETARAAVESAFARQNLTTRWVSLLRQAVKFGFADNQAGR